MGMHTYMHNVIEDGIALGDFIIKMKRLIYAQW